MRDFQRPGRSPVIGCREAVSTSHPLATASAAVVLAEGGNAVDAAVAAHAVLAVVDPEQTGIGGDCFALVSARGARPAAFAGAGFAPAAADAEWYRSRGFASMPADGPHSVTVPGAVDAWHSILDRFGTRGLDTLLQPAINYAEEGFGVPPKVAHDWARAADRLRGDPNAARLYLPGGGPPAAGTVVRNPALAETLRTIARAGRDAFYRGPIAEHLCAYLAGLGGLHDVADFAAYAGDWVAPISTVFRGREVFQCPPPNQGITALVLLDALERLPAGVGDPLDAARLHSLHEATKAAYLIRSAYVADAAAPDLVEALLSPETAQRIADGIGERARDDWPDPVAWGGSDTDYVCVVDRDHNVVSMINSVYKSFGSGLCEPETGILLQNRGAGFVLDPAHRNAIGPHKRPLHTIMPAMAFEGGRPVLAFGVVGGDFQPVGQVLLLGNLLDYGLDVQEAVDLPRSFATEGVIKVERGVPASTIAALEARGHRVVASPEPLGGAQLIRLDWEIGTIWGASDPRLDGIALAR